MISLYKLNEFNYNHAHTLAASTGKQKAARCRKCSGAGRFPRPGGQHGEGQDVNTGLDKIYHAAFVLRDVARRTDLIAAQRLGEGLYLKTENLQLTGSFKLRGAYYKISQLTEEERARGVIACSAGNHAQGVALAATRMGIPSVVCMPDGAPIMKVESTKRLGARVELVKGTYDDAHDRAVELQQQTGMTFIHPYDDDLVIAGQGTIGLEILDQLPDAEAIVVPIGGGGLIAGVALAVKSLRPDVKIYGVQAAGAASMYNAFRDKTYETLDAVDTFADGIAVKTPGEQTFEIIKQYVDDIVRWKTRSSWPKARARPRWRRRCSASCRWQAKRPSA